MKPAIGIVAAASLALVVAACGGGSSMVEEKCGDLIDKGTAAVERVLAGKPVGTYSGRGTVETGGTYMSGPVMQYAVRDDGSAIIGSVIDYQYRGELRKGVPNGVGVAAYSCDFPCQYAGEWRNGTKHGRGIMRLDDACYAGEWVYDEPHGEGTRYDVHVYHGLGTTTGTFRDGRSWSTDHYNDDELVGRTRNGDYAMADEYLANKDARTERLQRQTLSILNAVMEHME